MQIIILLLWGTTSEHGGGCQGANRRLDTLLRPPPAQKPVRGPVQSQSSGVTRVTQTLWSLVPRNRSTRRPNLNAASQRQSSVPLEASQRGQVITAPPFKESSSHWCCPSPFPQSRLALGTSHACWAFSPALYTSEGGAKSLRMTRLLTRKHPTLLLLVDVRSRHQTH